MEQDQRWNAGVIPYAQMGYYAPDYVPADTDLLAAFRITPHSSAGPAPSILRGVPGWPGFRAPRCSRIVRLSIEDLALTIK